MKRYAVIHTQTLSVHKTEKAAKAAAKKVKLRDDDLVMVVDLSHDKG